MDLSSSVHYTHLQVYNISYPPVICCVMTRMISTKDRGLILLGQKATAITNSGLHYD